MSQVINAIKQRRSIRKYQPRPVPPEMIREILDAAKYAPSAHNAQPWRFIVLTETMQKHNLTKDMIEAWLQALTRDGAPAETQKSLTKEYYTRFSEAPLLVVACLSLENMRWYPDEARQKWERDLAMQSLSAAIQNMLLVIYAKELGACWYAAPAFCKGAVRQALKIPAEVEPQALITIGYPAETPVASSRKPIETFSFLGFWDQKL